MKEKLTPPKLTFVFQAYFPPGQNCVPIFFARAPNRLMVQITVRLALDPTSETQPLKLHD